MSLRISVKYYINGNSVLFSYLGGIPVMSKKARRYPQEIYFILLRPEVNIRLNELAIHDGRS